MRKRIAASLTVLALLVAAAGCAHAGDDIQTVNISEPGEVVCKKPGVRLCGSFPGAATVQITVSGPAGVVFSMVGEPDASGAFRTEPVYLSVLDGGRTEYTASVSADGQENSKTIIREEDRFENIPAHSAGHRLDSSAVVSLIDVKGDTERSFPMIADGDDAEIRGKKIGSVHVSVDNWKLKVSAQSPYGRVSSGQVFVAETRDQAGDLGYAEFSGPAGGLGDTITLNQLTPVAVYVVLTVAANLSELSGAEAGHDELDGQKALFDRMQ